MYLRQVRLQNIACFDDVTLDFTGDDGEPCRWVVLLGENGTGKSTALQIVAGAIPNGERWPITDVGKTLKNLARYGTNQNEAEALISSTSDDEHRIPGLLVSAKISIIPSFGHGVSVECSHVPQKSALAYDDITGGWFAVGYRPWRGGRQYIEVGSGSTSYAVPAPKEHRFASMFDDYSKLTSVREWLTDLDYRFLKETGDAQLNAKRMRDLAISAIASVLPNPSVRFETITSTRDVLFNTNGALVSIDSLSDGYRSAMMWIGDLVRRLVEAFPDKENPLQAQGIVLVDEIDLHLHPKWQRTIVSQIREIFPNLQFIVTTHSPFIAQDMTENDKLIVLKREGDHVTVTEDKGFVSGWRADQILTSYLFGLESTRNTDVENAEAERSSLLNREAQSGLSDDDRATLDRVNALLANTKSPPDEVVAQTNVVAPTDDMNAAAHALLDLMAKQLDKHDEAA
jgi:hypothetical protein